MYRLLKVKDLLLTLITLDLKIHKLSLKLHHLLHYCHFPPFPHVAVSIISIVGRKVPSVWIFRSVRASENRLSSTVTCRGDSIISLWLTYGESEGYPSQHGIIKDAQAALDHLSQRADIDTSRIVVFGRSLGGAVGAVLTKNNPEKVSALILENTFTSILDMAGVLLPFLKWFIGGSGTKSLKLLNFVVRSPWKTIDAIGEVKQPVLFLSGLKDEMVPPFHMKMLYAKAATRNSQCTFVEFPSGMHMDTWLTGGDVYWRTVMQFLAKHAPEERKADTADEAVCLEEVSTQLAPTAT
ncbi:hypothetical protein F2Q69_00044431 [Brassica cretica]|uniref:Peptidase S9 prolyl oligopeptidase catalytic domain-containing protein n=1 Tax=Brassica cretica TaxID=69181 RepID=A0A8S9NT02_BRACR|nr:hypothetical protein F2Q69_00044431 [Brassica cretica]